MISFRALLVTKIYVFWLDCYLFVYYAFIQKNISKNVQYQYKFYVISETYRVLLPGYILWYIYTSCNILVATTIIAFLFTTTHFIFNYRKSILIFNPPFQFASFAKNKIKSAYRTLLTFSLTCVRSKKITCIGL